jgi:hypothetical protein
MQEGAITHRSRSNSALEGLLGVGLGVQIKQPRQIPVQHHLVDATVGKDLGELRIHKQRHEPAMDQFGLKAGLCDRLEPALTLLEGGSEVG